MAPRPFPKTLKLKTNHLAHGDCVSAFHYFSPVHGCLLHTFGWERVWYTCSSLFVDHASGKIFNFAQYSNNANKTIQSAQRLESMACDEGFRIKSYHSDNGIFVTKDLKDHCIWQQQKFSFSGVGTKLSWAVCWCRIRLKRMSHSEEVSKVRDNNVIMRFKWV